MTFLGTQPTFTHVPPRRCGSITAALAPYSAARCAQARPPLPPPTLMRSNAGVDTADSVLSGKRNDTCSKPDFGARLIELDGEQSTSRLWRTSGLRAYRGRPC